MYRNLIVSLIRLSEKKYYQSYFKDNYNNIRKTWDGIKSIINISNMKSMSPNSLNVNNKINTNHVDIANCFNDYFSNIGSKLAEKIFPSKYDHFHPSCAHFLDPHLHWKYHIHELNMKLSRATGMLSKIRHYVSYNTLISIYYAIFHLI